MALKQLDLLAGPSSEPSIGTLNGSKDEWDLMVAKRARLLFLAYSRSDYDDPDGAMATFARVLEDYPESIIRHATDPKTGIQRTCQYPPRVWQIVEFCDNLVRRVAEQKRREQPYIEPEPEFGEPVETRPTRAQLIERYGENWGLPDPKAPNWSPPPIEEAQAKWKGITKLYRDEPGRINNLAHQMDVRRNNANPNINLDQARDNGDS